MIILLLILCLATLLILSYIVFIRSPYNNVIKIEAFRISILFEKKLSNQDIKKKSPSRIDVKNKKE